MGPLPSQAPPTASQYRIFASFCSRLPPTSNWIESYNPSDNTWHHVGPIPGLVDGHALKGFAMVAIHHEVYVIGGRLCRRKEGSGDGAAAAEEDVAVVPTVLRCDAQSGEWSECAPLGTPRFDFACSVLGERIYVAGGKTALRCARGICSSEVYDPKANEWKSLPDMSRLRYKCVGVAWQGKMYVVGGFAERTDDSEKKIFEWTERSSVEVFDTVSGTWELNLMMWRLDVPPNQIVAVGDKLYSSGDCLNTWKGHIEAYDGSVNLWNVVEQSHLKNFCSSEQIEIEKVLYLTMAPIGSHLYFLAGYRLLGEGEAVRSMSAVYRFDTSAAGEAWSSYEPMEEQRDKQLCSHSCVARLS
ncbi:hypothetical protein ACLOJK_039359 [Asimina triloba]